MDKWLETKQIPSHCVSAAGVVYKDGKVLLIRSERRGWEIPGGIVEQGEAILDGLRREILEESGITAEKSKSHRPFRRTVSALLKTNRSLYMRRRKAGLPKASFS